MAKLLYCCANGVCFYTITCMENKPGTPAHILPVIVFAQFAGTSLWFAGNAIVRDLQEAFGLGPEAVGDLTAAVQLGFIAGTFFFALLSVADRFSPSRVFLFSAFLGAFFNLGIGLFADGFFSILLFRFLTGFFLAGIYPVGMKISADWYARGLGKALGFLVGALVLGTAFPHLLREYTQDLPWKTVLLATSGVAVFGGLLLFFLVGDGPNRRAGARFEWNAIPKIFRFRPFRLAAFGYFGHMWELYAFWAFVPVLLATYNSMHGAEIGLYLWSFAIIGMGSLGCVIGGYFSLRVSSARVAFGMLFTSGLLCLFSSLLFILPPVLFMAFLLLWGFAVVGDSPQFSTIVAQTAPPHYIGTALTIVNSIGFAITIGSIQLLNHVREVMGAGNMFLLLLPGPLFGLYALWQLAAKGVEMRP